MVPICEHIHDTGSRCGSPAVNNSQLCFFHQRGRQGFYRDKNRTLTYDFNVLESAESVQLAVTHISHALVIGVIDSHTANALFRGLALVLRTLKIKEKCGASDLC